MSCGADGPFTASEPSACTRTPSASAASISAAPRAAALPATGSARGRPFKVRSRSIGSGSPAARIAADKRSPITPTAVDAIVRPTPARPTCSIRSRRAGCRSTASVCALAAVWVP